jgi:WD40 repeat protein/transcriptional regulator with XRE-family HTH domain
MTAHRRYKNVDFRFGQMALTLREKAGLTQNEVAESLGVSRRTIQHWESGTAFPAGANLKSLIELYIRHAAFEGGHEREEARALWAQADESAARRKALFEDAWFDTILHQQHPVLPHSQEPNRTSQVTEPPPALQRIDWDEAPEVPVVYGRERELDILRQWVVADHCRVVAVLGIGGMGKTTLCLHLAHTIAGQFNSIIWRSLRNAPPLHELLADYFKSFSEPSSPDTAQDIHRSIAHLLDLLRRRRCLLILDNVETLLQASSLDSRYRAGYEDYRLFFQRVAETGHQSCIVLTSREMLGELEPLEGTQAPVRSIKLAGLARAASQALLHDKDIFGTPDNWEVFVQLYAGNPLALKIAAATVRNLFGGDLAAYLREAPVTLHTLKHLLEDQFDRLSPTERDAMIWLAIERDPVTLETLSADQPNAKSRKELLTALQSLWRRSLIERGERGALFSLLPVVLEYVGDRLVAQVADDIVNSNLDSIAAYALMKSQSADYVRDSQSRMLVLPVLDALMGYFGDRERTLAHVKLLVQRMQGMPPADYGYAAGNLVNLLVALQGHVRGLDFSNLALRQVYLQGVEAQDTNLAGTDVRDTRFTEPLETIISMKLSPDGQYLAVGSFSGQVRVWQLPDCTPVWSVKGHTRMAWALAFNTSATLLASGGYRGRVRVWDAAHGHLLRTFEGHQGWVRSVAFHPDGNILASAGDDATIHLWNVQEGTTGRVLTGHQGIIWSVTFTPDGQLLASGGSDGTIRLWDGHTGASLSVLQQHAGGVFSVAAHPDGGLLASGGEDGQINLWDIPSRRCLTTLQRHTTGTASIAFNPEGTLLAGGSNDGTVELWEIGNESNRQYVGTLQGHRWLVSSVSFAPQGLLASVAYGGHVKLWEVPSGKCLRTIQGYSRLICALAFNPEGTLLAQGDDNGMVRVWDVSSQRCLIAVQGHMGPVWTIAWSPDGQTFASGGDGGVVNLWQASSGRRLQSLQDHPVVIWALALSFDGSVLASGGAAGEIRLWDVGSETGAVPLGVLRSDWVWSLAFAPGGRALASGHANGEINIWDVISKQRIATLQEAGSPVDALHFLGDGETLISNSQEQLTWWDIASGRSVATASRQGQAHWIKAVAFSQDNALLAAGSDDRTVQLWRLDQDSNLYMRLTGHTGHIWAVTLSNDHRLLASSDDAGTILVWNTETGAVLFRLSPDRPYERMTVAGITGVSEVQRDALKALGAVEAAREAQVG